MARYLTRGMVVLADDHPGTGSALFAAREYTPRTIVVSSAGSAEVPTAQMVHPRGGASIDAAFRCAAEDMIPWVAMRRDYAPAEAILSQVLEATGRRARKDLPGFCVLLAGAEPRPIERILTVLDRADGQPSGLLILAAVATAQATGAYLDVLLMGAPGESMSTPASVQDAVRVSRDKDLYDQAIRRATEAGIRATWIAAEAVDDPRELVLAQVADGGYDLVIDDLGSVSLGGRLGRGARIARAVAPDGPAAIVRALLEQTDLPMVIVLDGVRLGLIPPAVVKGGAGTILALGLIASAAPAATASASELSAQQTTVSQTVDAYDAALGEAANLASPAEVDAALGDADAVLDSPETSTADEAGADEATDEEQAKDEEASSDAADEAAEDLSTVAPADLAPEEVAPEAAADVEADEVEVDEDVTADDLAEADEKAAEASDDLDDAQEDFDKAQDAAVDATKDAEKAAEHAEEAAAELTAAETEYSAVTSDATAVVADATGVSGALPGGASAEDLAAAETVQADAGADLAEVTQSADEAIDEYNEAAAQAAEAQAELDAAADAVTEADAAHEEASAAAAATEDAYQEVMADARLTPVPGASVGTHYGATGSVWSTGHHTGVDYPAPEGTEVIAAASGTVVEVGYDEAYGNRIVIEHEDGVYTTYNHLSDTDVEVGQEVTAGDHIGEVGNTGNSHGSHLHFEVTTGGDGWSSGSFENPEEWLAGG